MKSTSGLQNIERLNVKDSYLTYGFSTLSLSHFEKIFRSVDTEEDVQPPSKRPKKEQKDYPLPDYKAKNLIIVIRVLQTDKRKKNVLTLGRSVVETLSLKIDITWIEKLSEERSSAKAGHIFSALCEGIRRI